MSGTHDGGLKCRDTNLARYGGDYYQNLGRRGGSICGTKKGFAANIELAKAAGRKGGKISKRGKAKHESR